MSSLSCWAARLRAFAASEASLAMPAVAVSFAARLRALWSVSLACATCGGEGEREEASVLQTTRLEEW